MKRGEIQCWSSKAGKTTFGITGFLLQLNSQKNTGATNKAIHGHLQRKQRKG